MASNTSSGSGHDQQERSSQPHLPRFPAPRTMSTATAAFMGREKKMVFGCEWYFKPEGLKAVKKRFEGELSNLKKVARHEWNDDDQTFRIRCVVEDSDVIWQTFLTAVRDLIRQETGDGWHSDDESESELDLEDSQLEGQLIRSNKIQSLSVWKKTNAIIDTSSDSSHTDASDSDQRILASDFPDKMRLHKKKLTWELQDTENFLDDVVPDEMLGRLARLTGCEFDKDVNQGKIYIGSNSEDQCRLAVCKLDNVRKYSGLQAPYVKHIFYTEDAENFQLAVKSFADTKKKFFKTTLLDNLQLSQANDYQNLQHALTLRCAGYDPLRLHFVPFKAKFVPAIKTDLEKNSGPREWLDFIYSSHIPKGQEEENSMTRYEYYQQHDQRMSVQHPALQNITEATPQPGIMENVKREDGIKSWATQVPQDRADALTNSVNKTKDTADSFRKLRPEHQAAPRVVNRKPCWDSYNPYSPDDGDSKDEKGNCPQATRLTTSMSDFQQYQTVNLVPGEIAALPLSIKAQQWTGLKFFAGSNPPIGTGSIPDLLHQSPTMSPVRNEFKYIKQEWNEPDDLISFFSSPDKNTLLDDDISFLDSKFAVLQPVRNFSAPSPRKANKSSSKSPGGVGTPSSFPTQTSHSENLQQVSEVETRSFFFTMDQKAPSPNKQQNKAKKRSQNSNPFAGRLPVPSPPKPRELAQHTPVETIDPTPEFLREINRSFEELVRGLRGFRGKVVVQAEFGRLLLRRIHPRYVAHENSELSNDPEELSSILNPPNEKHGTAQIAFFSNILTVLPADVAFMVDMKDREGQSIWRKSQSSWDVSYEFLCRDIREAGYHPFTVEIDGERLDLGARVKTRRDFGVINVHGTKRNWDFRIAAVGFETNEKNDKVYGDLATAIMSTLHIPAGLRNPLLFFEIEEKLVHFQIFGVRVHRVCRYNSRDAKSVLNVSEVRELEIHSFNRDGFISYKMNGSDTPRVGCKWLDSWHEVSISSSKADEMFEQNQRIELGEEASWTSEKLTNINAAQAMYLPACEMLKQMDGVGFYNDNGAEIRAAVTSTPRAPPTNPVPYQFW